MKYSTKEVSWLTFWRAAGRGAEAGRPCGRPVREIPLPLILLPTATRNTRLQTSFAPFCRWQIDRRNRVGKSVKMESGRDE